MQLNSSTTYAIDIMLHLAKNKGVTSSNALSQSVVVSRRYLMQIAGKLRNGEMIGVNRGMGGGYFLLKEPAHISVYDIIILMEGRIRIIKDAEDVFVHHTLHEAFQDLQNIITNYLGSLTLDVLLDKTWPQCLEHLTDMMEPYYEAARIKAAQKQ